MWVGEARRGRQQSPREGFIEVTHGSRDEVWPCAKVLIAGALSDTARSSHVVDTKLVASPAKQQTARNLHELILAEPPHLVSEAAGLLSRIGSQVDLTVYVGRISPGFLYHIGEAGPRSYLAPGACAPPSPESSSPQMFLAVECEAFWLDKVVYSDYQVTK